MTRSVIPLSPYCSTHRRPYTNIPSRTVLVPRDAALSVSPPARPVTNSVRLRLARPEAEHWNAARVYRGGTAASELEPAVSGSTLNTP